jgi:hypothetical protein
VSVSDFHAAAGGTIAALGVGLTVFARAWTTTSPARHRASARFVPLDDLLGPPSAYTSYDTLTDVPALGPITPGFGECVPCGTVTAGSHSRDGFLCGVCFTPAGAA